LTIKRKSNYYECMDPKKQELHPELKQIYDRVMSTDVKRAPAGTPAPASQPGPTVAAPTAPNIPSAPSPAPAPEPTGPAPFLPTTPPKPAQAQSAPAAPQMNPSVQAKKSSAKSSFSGKIIALLVVVVLVAWGVLWAKIFALF
jgi:hypothetical protein